MARIITSLTLILFVFACKKNDLPGNAPAQTIPDQFYGANASQKMDIYLPADRSTSSTKLIVLIHGGGWRGGDKSDFNAYIPELQKRLPDYAIANINYRLAINSQNLFPTQEKDVKAAVEFLINKSGDYQFSRKWALLGTSAGGHLALLQAYKYTAPYKPQAVVSFFGPTDLVSLYYNSLDPASLQVVIGATPASNPTLYQQSSPISFVSAQSSPTILLHGATDVTVSPSQASLLRDKLQANNVVNQYILYPNVGHGWTGETLNDSFDKIKIFLDANVR